MIVTSVRLPKSLLDWVREQAAVEQIKPTALIRRWIEDRRRASIGQKAGAGGDAVAQLAERVSRLEAVALSVVAVEREPDGGGMAELLEALQASIGAARTKRRPPPLSIRSAAALEAADSVMSTVAGHAGKRDRPGVDLHGDPRHLSRTVGTAVPS